MMPVSKIRHRSVNTRREFNDAGLQELAADIRQRGIIQPLRLRPVIAADKKRSHEFEVVAGERRLRAAEIAGLKEVPGIIREMTDTEADEMMLVENLQREDVHPLDEAEGFLRLKEQGMEIADIATRVARHQTYIARRLALNDLIDAARDDFRKDLITLGHALEICRLDPLIQPIALDACFPQRQEFKQGKGWLCRAGALRDVWR